MKVVIREAAADDLDKIYDWITQENPRAAVDAVVRIRERIERLELAALAHMGRPGRVRDTRELVEYPYIIVYHVVEDRDEVIILSIIHGARDRQGG
ncbi:MAG TPA: type II toxin-antitoxin system RelE/ParE family toxin [Stellaceae bacterium]|jgi:addiction module RelE/StbE family toxin|nr:type II toxin-antitoxin system RelE/ParE family toxin [Stellaceae bacterium]